jgi:hypothetical protein
MYGKPAIHVISNAGRAGGIELLGPTIELTRENLLSNVHIHAVLWIQSGYHLASVCASKESYEQHRFDTVGRH